MGQNVDEPSLLQVINHLHRIDDKLDRVLIGSPGDEGLLTRVARIEERQGRGAAWFWAACCAGLAVGGVVARLVWMMPQVPN